MPLSATYLGERVESWSMTSDDWAELKLNYRTSGLVMSCGQDGIPKNSSLGTQFFAHKNGTDCQLHEGAPESPEHLATKAAVARAAREIGWDAVIEFPAADRSWIADVLVSNGERMIAIEAQWSPQSLFDFERRQARYEAAGIECLWLTAPVNSQNAATVPSYKIAGSVDDLQIRLPALPTPYAYELGDGIKAILQQEILPVAEFIATRAVVKSQMSKCWKCEKWMSLWTVTALDLESRCGGTTAISWPNPWKLWALDRHEKALEGPIRQAIEKSDLPAPAALRIRYSPIEQRNYLAMNCPSCGIVQGDGKLAWHWGAELYSVPLGQGIRLALTDKIRARTHVCGDIGRGRCSQDLAAAAGYPESSLFPPESEFVERGGSWGDYASLPPRGSRRRQRQ